MKALYRKYRPCSLDEVIGEDSIVNNLKNALKDGKTAHAYLFTGPRGTGKTSIARIFAHEINHFPYTIEDNYTDIIEIDAASNTGVDNIRELREKAVIAPSEGKYKVYIIDEVHMLSKSAFNALLKTLEEPPEHVIFLLATTDIEKVPVTITSRVQIFTFHLAPREVMLPYLKNICEKEKINIDDDALEIVARRGGGSFRDTLSLLGQISALTGSCEKITAKIVTDSLGLPVDSMVSTLLESYRSGNLSEISDNLKSILSSGVKPETLASTLIEKILINPESVFLPLLEKLTEVHGLFPEAKLLLAFSKMPQEKISYVSAPSFSAPAMSRPDFQRAPAPVVKNPPENPKTFYALKEAPREAPEPAPAPSSTSFTFDGYIDVVKKSSLGAAMWLKKSRYEISGSTLRIIPNSETTRGILTSANNYRALIECLAPFSLTLEVCDPSGIAKNPENSIKNDPKLSQINDIMGGVKEVNIDGGVPF